MNLDEKQREYADCTLKNMTEDGPLNEQLDSHQNLLTHALEQLSIHQEELRCQNEELLATQEELNRSHRMYQDLFERAPLAYLLLDDRGLIMRVNLPGESLLLDDQGNLLNRPFDRFLHPDDQPGFIDFVHLVSSTEGICTFECRLLQRGNVIQNILVEAARITDEENGLATIRMSLLDTTELWQARDRMEESHRVAEQASRAKSEFLAVMSHEVRTPLNAIIGVNNLLADTPLSDAQLEMLGNSQNAARSLLHLLEDILDFSQLESRTMQIEERPFDLHALLRRNAGLYRYMADKKGLLLTLTLDETLPHTFLGAAARINQVISNLLNNAIKYTLQGAVSLSAIKLPDNPSRPELVGICLMVRDTGIGIPPDKQESIFEMFTQLDSSSSRSYEGVGLGLTICKQLVEMMGGSISVVSLPGIGSTFSVRLFLPQSSLTAAEEISPADSITFPLPARRYSLSVLLADDNEINRRIQSALLERLGFQVEITCDGNELVHAASRSRYDLILTDISMPVMDGVTATRAIRALPDKELSNVPIIALTAHAVKGDRERFMAAGLDGYLTKPLNLQDLVGLVDDLFPEASSPAVQPAAPASLHESDLLPDIPDGVLNIAYIRDNYLCLGCQDLLREVTQAFCAAGPEQLAALRRLDAENNLTELAKEAHTLKGLSGTVGAQQIHILATELTEEARKGINQNNQHLIKALEQELATYAQAITTYLNRL
jgi:signal transduction histidine kinase/HPt (histidine-containing phosphotransfer) domain-containing protein/ActR/RegA family two-component response regulator